MILIIFFFVAGNVMAQSGKVGINTSLPVTGLHVQDSGVLFNHGFYLKDLFKTTILVFQICQNAT